MMLSYSERLWMFVQDSKRAWHHTGPSRATVGPRNPLLWGFITTLFRMRRRHRSSPSGVRGRAPAETDFYAYLRPKRSHLEHTFRYFWTKVGPPKCRGARENFPPFLPSRWAWHHLWFCSSDLMSNRRFAINSTVSKSLKSAAYSHHWV